MSPDVRARSLSACLVAVAAVSLAACGSDTTTTSSGGSGATSGPTKLRVAYVPVATVLPLQVAKAQGYFAKNGLDVTLKPVDNISDIPATLGRQFDIGLGTSTDLIRAGSAGVDVLQIAGNTVDTKSNPIVQLITRPDTGIKSVKDLEGKKVGSPTLSGVIHTAVLFGVAKAGGDPDKVQGVQVPSPNIPDQLKAKRIDAAEALEPFATKLKKAGNVSLGDPFAAIGRPLATNFWIAQGSWARGHRDAIRRYVASLNQAITFIKRDPQAARSVLRAYTKLPAPVTKTVRLPTWNVQIRTQDLAKWVGVLKQVGSFKGDADPQKLVLEP